MEEKKQQMVYGRHPVIEAIRSGRPLDKLMLQQGIRGDFEKEIRQLSQQYNIPLRVVPREKLNREAGGNHQGVVGVLAPAPFYRLADLLPLIYERGETPLMVVLEGVTDVRNFGAIARTAECIGAHGLIIGRKNSAQFNAEAIKASAGALHHIPVCRERSIISAMETLRDSGIQILASDLRATEPLQRMDLRAPVALLLGAEGKGISPAVARAADHRFIIPQRGVTDSLNVSVAAGMMLYEAARQRFG